VCSWLDPRTHTSVSTHDLVELHFGTEEVPGYVRIIVD
jgi:uncharacterized membrane protein affecting hemolysin expression